MSQAALRIVEPIAERDILRFERRKAIRHPMSGHVIAVRAGSPYGQINPKICSLDLFDISNQGLGAVSSEPVDVGSRITVQFPPHGPDGSCDAHGRVVRCIAREFGFEIGIHLEARSAA